MRKHKRLKEKFQSWNEESHSFKEESRRLHIEYHQKKRELCRQQRELERGFRAYAGHTREQQEAYERLQTDYNRQQQELQKQFNELRKSKVELHRLQRHARFSPLFILIYSLLIWYLVFKYVGIKAVSVFLAILVSGAGCLQYFFLRKLESRILTPIYKLKAGFEEIGKGNYDVEVESNEHNQISLLIDSFNKMADKLMESEKIKIEYEENRRRLIANISHDLKTPITSIQGYIEAITEGNTLSTENTNKYLKIIHNNAAYINKLIDDLFLFSKLDMQKLEMNFEAVNVKPFVGDIMEEFQLEVEESNIIFNYADEMEVESSFNIDRKRLHQVFRNIIDNAVKYGSGKNLLIETRLYRLEDLVYIEIKDNGPGIPKDKLPHIFERFYRIDNERTKDFSSTGLGLAIAKELVEAHGGEITVSSVENVGACFTVMLPIIH